MSRVAKSGMDGNSQTEGTQTIAWTAERIAVEEGTEGMDSFKLA